MARWLIEYNDFFFFIFIWMWQDRFWHDEDKVQMYLR
jgi:hypothetical protein